MTTYTAEEVQHGLEQLRFCGVDARHQQIVDGIAAYIATIEAERATPEAEDVAAALDDAAYVTMPPFFAWELTDRTTPSGKNLFRCSICGVESPTPDRWKYHAAACFAETTAALSSLTTENARLTEANAALVEVAKDASNGCTSCLGTAVVCVENMCPMFATRKRIDSLPTHIKEVLK